MESLGNGDIGRKRKMIKTIMASFLRSTYEPDRLTGRPFKPDAMLCNPPSFAHVHLAERFASPLVMSFSRSNANVDLALMVSYAVVTDRCFQSSIGQPQSEKR